MSEPETVNAVLSVRSPPVVANGTRPLVRAAAEPEITIEASGRVAVRLLVGVADSRTEFPVSPPTYRRRQDSTLLPRSILVLPGRSEVLMATDARLDNASFAPPLLTPHGPAATTRLSPSAADSTQREPVKEVTPVPPLATVTAEDNAASVICPPPAALVWLWVALVNDAIVGVVMVIDVGRVTVLPVRTKVEGMEKTASPVEVETSISLVVPATEETGPAGPAGPVGPVAPVLHVSCPEMGLTVSWHWAEAGGGARTRPRLRAEIRQVRTVRINFTSGAP
jgi:hypothetical protein